MIMALLRAKHRVYYHKRRWRWRGALDWTELEQGDKRLPGALSAESWQKFLGSLT